MGIRFTFILLANFWLPLAFGLPEGFRTDAEVLQEMEDANLTLVGGDMYVDLNDNSRASWDMYENWPNNMIPYVVSDNITDDLKAIIPKAIKYIKKYTCIKFRDADPSKDDYWVRFLMDPNLLKNPNSSAACSARLGWTRKKDQPVKVGKKCTFGSMVHELLHTLGFGHEHNRPDRDDFIDMHFENMKSEAKSQYIRDDIHCKDLGVPEKRCKFGYHGVNYNYDSIMHYCTGCGAKRGLKAFTSLENPDAEGQTKNIGQRNGFSEGDWLMINRKYGCDPANNPKIPRPDPIPDVPTIENDFEDDEPKKNCKKSRKA